MRGLASDPFALFWEGHTGHTGHTDIGQKKMLVLCARAGHPWFHTGQGRHKGSNAPKFLVHLVIKFSHETLRGNECVLLCPCLTLIRGICYLLWQAEYAPKDASIPILGTCDQEPDSTKGTL